MKSVLFRVVLLFAVLGSAYPLRWPVDNPIVVESFGETRNGMFSSTISIRSDKGNIYAIADGRLVYMSGKSPDPELNIVIIEHENGLRSIYRNFFPLKVISGEISEGQVIGTGPAVQLEILDTHSGEIGNPQILLPRLDDRRRPVIERLAFYSNGVFEDLKNKMNTVSGHRQLLLKVYDPHSDERLLPFSITLFIDSQKVQEYVFESLKYIDGRYQFPWAEGKDIFILVDGEMYINLGEFFIMPGETRLELYVEDLAENRTSLDIKLIAARNR